MDTISARVNTNNKVGEIHSTSVWRVFLDPVNHLDSRSYTEKMYKEITNYLN